MKSAFIKEGDGKYHAQGPVSGDAILEQAKVILDESLRRTSSEEFRDPHAVRDFLRLQLARHKSEVFAVLFLDNRHRLIEYEELFHGTIDGASVHPREVVRRALHHNAAAAILAHNHPSGVAEPSEADRRITQRLKETLALIDVRVLDHIVIGAEESTSLAERGLI